MSLKIKPEHYALMDEACKAVLAGRPGLAENYASTGLSEMGFNWNVLRAATIEGVKGTQWICSNLYPYLSDEHISSASYHGQQRPRFERAEVRS